MRQTAPLQYKSVPALKDAADVAAAANSALIKNLEKYHFYLPFDFHKRYQKNRGFSANTSEILNNFFAYAIVKICSNTVAALTLNVKPHLHICLFLLPCQHVLPYRLFAC